jgi:competence protein ComEC
MPPLVSLSLAFLVGIAVSGATGAAWPSELLILSALIAVAALLLWRDRRGFFVFACSAAFLLGCVRYQAAVVSPRDALARYNDAKAVTLQGIVAAPPDVRDSGASLRVEVSRIRSGNLPCTGACDWTPMSGLVLVLLPRFGDYQYGDQLELSGAMRAPPSQADFSYRDYLARQDIYSLMDRPRALRLASGQGNPLYMALYALRERAHVVITQSLPEPQSGLLSGILLGLARDIPTPTIDAFNRTSTSHIIAISGYN